ncbi:dihydrofolate reductase family protein [Dietzia timorensis]|uniref:Bacterial bifunctional deaminase-reductase C-terminal domain-containing protein n=1 Tax=Dietzia timorensis TaxID=499555 RepID=A0A173LPU8_9ACTN|nr:dihydrofolate reductase family protein [Dietzia timorensis]ANI93714.1 Hypothetical protein BJL86_2955 [Dietzia timorensis]
MSSESREGAFVVSVLTSLDGYFEGPGGDLSPMPFEDAFNTHNLELLRQADTVVYGSTWFPNNFRHWSAIAQDQKSGRRDVDTARLVTTLASLVISDSMTIGPGDPWAPTSSVVARSEAPAEIARRKANGESLLMFGSATTWNPLLAAGVVDELIVLVGAAMLGEGSKMYTGERAGLRLLEASVVPDSELVKLRYDARC